MAKELPYRKARFAGAWYAEDPRVLRSEIDGYLDACTSESNDYQPRIGVLPHAGLFYSGRGIAHFFRCLPEQTNRVCILAPSHYEYLRSDQVVSAEYSFLETPLGNLPFDPMCGSLNAELDPKEGEKALKSEHAVEMFLPFIARMAEQRNIDISVALGLVSRFSSVESIEKYADKLIERIGEEQLRDGRTVLIASSDFTHYGSRFDYTPYGVEDIPAIQKAVKTVDIEYAEGIAGCEVSGMFERCSEEHPTICGIAPALLASTIACRLGFTGRVVDYYNSNDLAQTPLNEFVSYCTVIWE
jgi:AmmeMemoRadiSam system protein B